jgi:hypothetical protein
LVGCSLDKLKQAKLKQGGREDVAGRKTGTAGPTAATEEPPEM